MNNNHAECNVLIRALCDAAKEIQEPAKSVMSDLTYINNVLFIGTLYFIIFLTSDHCIIIIIIVSNFVSIPS